LSHLASSINQVQIQKEPSLIQQQAADDLKDEHMEHTLVDLDEEQPEHKDLSNPASQDYFIEKLKDMEQQSRLVKGSNENSERFVPKQINMPDEDEDSSEQDFEVELPDNYHLRQDMAEDETDRIMREAERYKQQQRQEDSEMQASKSESSDSSSENTPEEESFDEAEAQSFQRPVAQQQHYSRPTIGVKQPATQSEMVRKLEAQKQAIQQEYIRRHSLENFDQHEQTSELESDYND